MSNRLVPLPARRAPRAILLLGSALLATLGACGDVAKCRRGEQGCWQGPTFADGTCRFDLVPRAGVCLKKGESGAGSADICDDWSDGEVLVATHPGARCTYTNTWTSANGTADDLFNLVCYGFCVQDRVHAMAYCGDVEDIDATCATPDNSSPNHTLCMQLAQAEAGSSADLATLTKALEGLCREAVSVSCSDTACTEGTPQCSKLAADLCFDDCGDFRDDGYCDDGDVLSADTSDCAYGHDCTDCGPRTVPEKSALKPAPVGASCVTHVGCEGFDSHFTQSDAFCAYPTPDNIDSRCLPSCTGSRTCPSDMECKTLYRTTASGNDVPFTIFDKEGPAKACFPTTCG